MFQMNRVLMAFSVSFALRLCQIHWNRLEFPKAENVVIFVCWCLPTNVSFRRSKGEDDDDDNEKSVCMIKINIDG